MTRQLATLIDAAVPVDEALAMIAAQQEQPAARRIIADVQAGVVEGQRLADALVVVAADAVAIAPQVHGHDVKVLLQARRDPVPGDMGLRVAVHQQQRRT